MPGYIVTGKLGAGKGLCSVGRMQEYLLQGRKVATNLDLWLENLLPSQSRATAIRLPDKPRIEDLEAIGNGADLDEREYDESRTGLLVLDECGSWLNSRSWNDKDRAAILEWLLHARKRLWDVILIIQDEGALDKQIRESICDHTVVCKRLDRIGVPIIGGLTKMITGHRLKFPQIHIASIYYGDGNQRMRVDRWSYTASKVKDGYDTRQIFKSDYIIHEDAQVDMRAPYTILSPWHVKGRITGPTDWRKIAFWPLLATVWLMIQIAATLQGRRAWDVAASWGISVKRQELSHVPEGTA